MMNMTPTAIDPFHSLCIIQQNPDGWGNFKYFPNELISQIFFWVMKGKTGATGFNRLMRLSQHVHAFCHWTTKYIPFPLTGEIKFNRTHLNKAAGKGSLESIQHLLKHKSIPPDTDKDLDALLEAIQHNQKEAVELLWKEERIQKIDFDVADTVYNPFIAALRDSHLEIASWLWDTGRFTSNHLSAHHLLLNGDAQLINKVVGNVIRPNNAYNLMSCAIAYKSTEFMKVLLRKRAMLMDCLGPLFKVIALAALMTLISTIAGGILLGMISLGIAAWLGKVVVVKMIVELAIGIGAGTALASSLILIVGSIAIIAHHLLTLARAAVLVGYHDLKQKISMARKI